MAAYEIKKRFDRLPSGDWKCSVDCDLEHPTHGKLSVPAGTIIKRGIKFGGWLDADWLERYEDS